MSKPPNDNLLIAELAKLHSQGRDPADIAVHLGYSEKWVREQLTQLGLLTTYVRPQARYHGTDGQRREQAYNERYWVKDPTYRPKGGRVAWGGYWVHPDPDPGHGTVGSYVRYGCRCPRCRAAQSEYQHYVLRGQTAVKPASTIQH